MARPAGRWRRLADAIQSHIPRVVVDTERRLGDFRAPPSPYPIHLCKEDVARRYVLGRPGTGLKFLDVGARDGRLDYLLGVRRNLQSSDEFYAVNRARFNEKYSYHALDLVPLPPSVIGADICRAGLVSEHPDLREAFDVAYCNNVFEHLRKPWIAAANMLDVLRTGGIAIVIAPFAIRYHEVPRDYFRFTHDGLVALFEDAARIRVLEAGFDTLGRRNDWQGSGEANDVVVIDKFGAWRENWFSVAVVEKVA